MNGCSSVVTLAGWAHDGDSLKEFGNWSFFANNRLHRSSTYELKQSYLSRSSKTSQADESLSPYSSELLQLLRELPGEITLIGWSMGAVVAIETVIHLLTKESDPSALRFPIKRLLILSGGARFCTFEDDEYGTSPSEVRALGRLLQSNTAAAIRGFLLRCNEPASEYSAQHIERSHASASTMHTAELGEQLRYLAETDLRKALSAEIGRRFPRTLLVHGVQDKVFPVELGRELATLLPKSHSLFIDGAGHNLSPWLAAKTLRYIEQFICDD